MMTFPRTLTAVATFVLCSLIAADDEPAVDTSRGDALLAEYFEREVSRIEDSTFADIETLEDWTNRREEYHRQMMYMLGLDPLPERTELHPVITGTIDHPEMTVENLHFQSMPGLYVTGNLYLPKGYEGPRPTILYVCGHGGVEIDGIHYGNKVHYQHHGEWFARHGYVCLTIDTIQLGEIQGLHHGNYSEGMWWWYSRGYTPAGVEAWNCIRALDYLETRPEVDATKFGVTGRSGGGAYSWWIAAIDERIACAVPVAGITSLRNHVIDGCVEGHCDCMYMINTYAWDFPMVAALVAPRPLLISNTDKDGIFPLDGVYDVYAKVRRIYELYGAEVNLGLDINEGPHEDTQPLQVAAFEWMNRHLIGPDIVIERAATPLFTPPELRVFDQLPADERVTTAHDYFVPLADAREGTPEERLKRIVDDLKEVTFRGWPENDVHGMVEHADFENSEDNVEVIVKNAASQTGDPLDGVFVTRRDDYLANPEIHVLRQEEWEALQARLRFGIQELRDENPTLPTDQAGWDLLVEALKADKGYLFLPPRGVGPTEWARDEEVQTHIRRRFMLIGQTLDGMRVWDVYRMIQSCREELEGQIGDNQKPFSLHGAGEAAVWCLYAALIDAAEHPDDAIVDRLVLTDLPGSHMDPDCPELLNVLRITDIPQVVELLSEFREVELLNSETE
jgi:dienelactone hydrolase